MRNDLRSLVAANLSRELERMQREADRAKPAALALRAALRQGVGGAFGHNASADAALLRLLSLPVDEDGQPPVLDARLGHLLDDASLVVALVAATRVGVYEPRSRDGAHARRWNRSLGRDLRAIRLRRPTASDDLLSAMLRVSREQLPRQLRRALTLMADDGAPLDVHTLIADLEYWESDNHGVQKRWAYHFWSGPEARARDTDDNEETA